MSVNSLFEPRRNAAPRRLHLTATACASALWGLSAQAFDIPVDNPDVKARWDTTVGYSLGFRTERPAPGLSAGPNGLGFDDGDRNFAKRRRPIADRFDVFSEADVSFRGFGARVSAAGWYDFAYNTPTSNRGGIFATPPPAPYDPANTLNSGGPGQFPTATRRLHGHKAEFLDTFVFGKFDLGDTPLNVRLGKHALLWGESLFFAGNAIAGGMAPIDIIKALSSPNAQVKEIVRPVGQLSAQSQITSDVSVGAYYQYEWQKSRIPGVGSYYSTNDSLGDGAERIFIGQTVPTPGGPLTVYVPALHGEDPKAPKSGQFGVQTHFRIPQSDIDFGLYAIQFHAKLPVGYLNVVTPPGQLPDYRLVYPEKIRAYAASFNTTVGVANFGGEVSFRTNVPLARGLMLVNGTPFAGPYNAADNPAYGVGRTLHINLSTITAIPPFFLARESSLAAELAFNHVLSCTRNCANIAPGPTQPFPYQPLDANSERTAYGMRLVYTPTYRQAFSGIDLSVPVGLSYSPKGRSQAAGPIFVNHGGDMSIGLSANVRESFTVAMNYVHYYGPSKTSITPDGYFSYGQSLADRDNVTLSARISF